MNRRYTREEYLDLIKRIYKRLPNIAIGTDIIVGFSGETDADFQDTVDLYKQSDFDISYTAIYSERSGTLADKVFDDDVPRSEKKKRWKILQDLMKEIVYRKNQKFVGQTVSVLVDEFDPVKKVCRGQSGEIKLVQFSGSKDLIGTIVDVKVTEAKEWVLIGALNS